MTADELVQMILADSPVTAMDGFNVCRFCGTVWPEKTFAEWLNRDAQKGNQYIGKHHDNDCVWVLANQVTS